jgi:hypothetical protein
VFELEHPLVIDAPTEVSIALTFKHSNPRHSIGCFRLSVSSIREAVPVVGEVGPPAAIVEAVARLRDALKKNPQATLNGTEDWMRAAEWYKTQDAGFQQRTMAVVETRKAGAGEQLATALVTSEVLPIMSHHANDRGFPHFYPETYLLRRGDVHQKVERVDAGFLQVLTSAGAEAPALKTYPNGPDPRSSGRRSTLARWITDDEQGAGQLAARVMANRVWQHHFGRGLVATPNDFGTSGERPSHPELLDYLASELIAGGWRLKQLHKLIMTSGVYIQSSEQAAEDPRQQIDRENQLYWRRAPRRLEAEAIRDAMLAATGQLDMQMYGPGSLDSSMRRRSVYFFIKRSQLVPMMMLFDWPEHMVSIGQRPLTTIAPQALMFMNNSQGRECALALAMHVETKAPEVAVERAYWAALSRPPRSVEAKLAIEFLKQQAALRTGNGEDQPELMALADLCQTILSMNEFVYVD